MVSQGKAKCIAGHRRNLLRTPCGLVVGEEVVNLPSGNIGLAVRRKGQTDTVTIEYLLAQLPTIDKFGN